MLGRWGVCSAGRRCWEEVWAGWIGGLGLNYCVSTAICAICILTGTGASRRMASVEVVVPCRFFAACGCRRGHIDWCLWYLPWLYRWLLAVSAAAISIAPCGHRRGHIDCPLWFPPRQYLLLLVVTAAVLSMAPCGFRRGIIDGSLWSPPRLYRSLLAVAAVARLMGARGLHCDAIESHSCLGRHYGVLRVRYVCFVVCRLRSAVEDGAA